MAAIASPDAVHDPFVQVFGTIFVGFIALVFVGRMAVLAVELLRQRRAGRIEEAVRAAGGTISLKDRRVAEDSMADAPEPEGL